MGMKSPKTEPGPTLLNATDLGNNPGGMGSYIYNMLVCIALTHKCAVGVQSVKLHVCMSFICIYVVPKVKAHAGVDTPLLVTYMYRYLHSLS